LVQVCPLVNQTQSPGCGLGITHIPAAPEHPPPVLSAVLQLGKLRHGQAGAEPHAQPRAALGCLRHRCGVPSPCLDTRWGPSFPGDAGLPLLGCPERGVFPPAVAGVTGSQSFPGGPGVLREAAELGEQSKDESGDLGEGVQGWASPGVSLGGGPGWFEVRRCPPQGRSRRPLGLSTIRVSQHPPSGLPKPGGDEMVSA